MKKILLFVVLGSFLGAKSYSKSVYPTINHSKQAEKKSTLLSEEPNNEQKSDSTFQELTRIEKKLKHLYWAQQAELVEELKQFDPNASLKGLKYLKKKIADHLEKKQKTLDQFADDIKQESVEIETCIIQLNALDEKTTDQEKLKQIQTIKDDSTRFKQNLVELTSIVNALLLGQ
jgi:hypothetical protein